MNVFFYVQHLLGTGHFYRSAAIANALSREGLKVFLISGGMPLKNTRLEKVELLQLPALRARNGNFADLVDEHNQPVDSDWWHQRQQVLMQYWSDCQPSALVTESYPFARRMLRHELIPLLQVAQQDPNTKISVCSVRDIPQPKTKAGRSEEAISLIENYYSHVLVHGDPTLAKLTETFPEAERIADKITYTGYVDAVTGDPPASTDRSDVLVSAGGGAAGLSLYRVAIEAAQTDDQTQWRLLVGNNLSPSDFDELRRASSGNVIVERNRPDFRGLLKAAVVSVSQAGYNTVVDVVRSGVNSVLVPYAKGDEHEQTIRARKLALTEQVVLLTEQDLNSSSLIAAVQKAKQLKPLPLELDINGAKVSASMIDGWLRKT